MSGLQFGLLSFVFVAIALVLWFRWMNEVTLAGRRSLLFALCGVGAGLGGVALVHEPGWVGGALAIGGMTAGILWIGLGLLGKQSKQLPNLTIGQTFPAIAAPDHTGALFEVASLRGQPVLIKLFRGHW